MGMLVDALQGLHQRTPPKPAMPSPFAQPSGSSPSMQQSPPAVPPQDIRSGEDKAHGHPDKQSSTRRVSLGLLHIGPPCVDSGQE